MLRFRPTHRLTLTRPDATRVSVVVQLEADEEGAGPAYTRQEWERHTRAHWARSAEGVWTYDGQTVPGGYVKVEVQTL